MKRSFRHRGGEPNGSRSVATLPAAEPAPHPAGQDAKPAKPAKAEPKHAADTKIHSGGGRLGEIVVESRLATREQVVTALQDAQESGKRLGRMLVELGALDDRDLARVIAKQKNLDDVDLRRVAPEPEAVDLIREAVARKLLAIPLSIEADGSVVVAVADPSDETVQALKEATGHAVTLKVAAESDVVWAIRNSYRALSGVQAQIKAFESRDEGLKLAPMRPDAGAMAEADAPVVQVVQALITQGLRDRASDIHIEPQEDRIRVRYRVDGALHDVLSLPLTMGPAIVSRLKIMAGMNIVERRRAQDGQISLDVEDREVDIRVATTSVVHGEKVVLRLLDKSRPMYRLEQLGMPTEMVEQYASLLHSPYGMVICAGPTGSGKTTTLYGSLGEINTPERNIMTIEDPVEYTIPSINQIQINEQAGVTFAGGLRSILRQDPDIILVGEIRDVETARIAVQSALTGHFVLSSLHATDAAAALHRLLDMGIESFLVASSVSCVLSQRLVRRICDNCVETYDPPAEELAFLRGIGGHEPEKGFVRGAGCNFCAHTGYLERIGVYEMMPITNGIRELVLARASHDEIRRVARAEGMRSLQEAAVRLVEDGVTNLGEVLRAIYVAGG